MEKEREDKLVQEIKEYVYTFKYNLINWFNLSSNILNSFGSNLSDSFGGKYLLDHGERYEFSSLLNSLSINGSYD